MSLGGGIYEPLDLKVVAMGAKGIFVALAAGNESDDANNHSPARANGPNIYTISACDVNDYFASFSNYGNPPVDFCAPGVGILSTYKGDALATMSGTSMAAPHACGVLLVTNGNPKTSGYVINDPDGEPDPIIHN
jgi:subtilisin family serine protease